MFFITFLGIYFGGNFYILWRLFGLLRIKRRFIFALLLVILTFSFIGAIILEQRFGNALTKLLYVLASHWMGAGILLLACLVAFEVINIILKIQKPYGGIAVLAIASIASIYAMINARILHITTVDIPATVNMNIAQLSDIHLGSVGGKFLSRVVEKTNSLNPDVVVITGDLVDSHHRLDSAALARLNDLAAPVFFVLGNHERYAGLANVMSLLETTKVKTLRNDSVTLDGLQIIGIDDENDVADRLKHIEIDPAKFAVLLYHRPEGLEAASKTGIDLMLSGHTHNGQIFPFNFYLRQLFPYVKGLYRHENLHLYVSTGTGTWGPRMRLGSKSEIILLKLHPPASPMTAPK
jgi:predicted MPP superfamily phosphohydrolase